MTVEGCAPDRIERVRRILEEEDGESGVLYAARAITHQPWADLVDGDRVRARSDDPREAQKERDSASVLKRVFPDIKVTVDDAVERDDKVVVRWTMTGTHEGEVADIKPTGERVALSGINIYRFVGDHVVESWGEMDAASLANVSKDCSSQLIETLARPPEEILGGRRMW